MTSFRTPTRFQFLNKKLYFCAHIAENAKKTFGDIGPPPVDLIIFLHNFGSSGNFQQSSLDSFNECFPLFFYTLLLVSHIINFILGYNVLYVCGTDEYGTATETKAYQENLELYQKDVRSACQDVCDKYAALHTEVYDWFQISTNHFGRTTTKQQEEIVHEIYHDLGKDKIFHQNNKFNFSLFSEKIIYAKMKIEK